MSAKRRASPFGPLESRFDALSPELQRAARWVQANPREVGVHSS